MADTEFAKAHLRDHLSSLLIPPVCDGFWSIQKSSKELCDRNNTPDQCIRTFQNLLTKIPDWSDATVSTEVERIQKVSKCNYLDDLVMGIFIAYMKSFANLHFSERSKEIELDFEKPTLAKFVHEMYIHSARKLWQVAYLFKTQGVSSETQARSRQEIETILNQSLEQVIRSFLPWETITKKYFSSQSAPPPLDSEDEEDEEEEEEEEEEKEVRFEDPPPKLELSDEDATLDIAEAPAREETDPLKEIEGKVQDTLVLNL